MSEVITYGSLCSGIEAASVAWEPLGWRGVWLSEIAGFPSAVLAARWPGIPNLGDMTADDFVDRAQALGGVDVLIGGTPCQAFSVAGQRGGLSDARGNLTLRFVEIADAIRPTVLLWENVPGVLSSKDNAFGCFLAGIVGGDAPVEPGPRPAVGACSRLWRWDTVDNRHIPRWPGVGVCTGPERKAAWRILDAQYFGVPQRRRRVFVAASPGESGVCPVEILFDAACVSGDSAAGVEARAEAAGVFGGGAGGASEEMIEDQIAHALLASHDASEDGSGRGIPLVADTVAAKWAKGTGGPSGDECQNLVADTLTGSWHKSNGANAGNNAGIINPVFDGAIRRLTPRECERLQGFPDDYTAVERRGKIADGPRYEALGNSMAVPVIQWIGRRIEAELMQGRRAV